jgi:hypothetical protein
LFLSFSLSLSLSPFSLSLFLSVSLSFMSLLSFGSWIILAAQSKFGSVPCISILWNS